MNAASGRLRTESVVYTVNGRPQPEAVRELFAAVGWPDPGVERLAVIERVWNEAPCTVLAFDNELLVGVSRVMWDGGEIATIINVIVHPDYQGQGIGTRMVQLLLKEIEKLNVSYVTLNAVEGTERFYSRLGFVSRQNVIPMRLHNSNHKEQDHVVRTD